MPAARHRLRPARVLRVNEQAGEIWTHGKARTSRFAAVFPSPRVERVSPGHLVAVATAPDGSNVVVWRWYDAVVLDTEGDGSVRLWEPAHGEVVARPRPSYREQEPGSRAFVSAGLPGAEWWVTGTDVELDVVDALYTDNDLWPTVFDPNT